MIVSRLAPDTRTMPIPPRPGGVAIAAMVSGGGGEGDRGFQPNGPMLNTMLTMANKPINKRSIATMGVNETGNWLSA
jgi:hypothetical protein